MAKTKDTDWVVLDRLAGIILANVKGCVVDIGIGASTRVLMRHSKEFGRDHYTCDIRKRRCDWAKQRGLISFCGISLNFIKWFPEIPVALCFIDGYHLYDVVIEEVKFFLTRLQFGGVIFLHDTYPPPEWASEHGAACGNVYKVRQEMEESKSVQTFTWPYTACDCGLTMLMKKGENPPYTRA